MEDRHSDMTKVLAALPPRADLDGAVESNVTNGERYLIEGNKEGGHVAPCHVTSCRQIFLWLYP